jgi:hypothetical protein
MERDMNRFYEEYSKVFHENHSLIFTEMTLYVTEKISSGGIACDQCSWGNRFESLLGHLQTLWNLSWFSSTPPPGIIPLNRLRQIYVFHNLFNSSFINYSAILTAQLKVLKIFLYKQEANTKNHDKLFIEILAAYDAVLSGRRYRRFGATYVRICFTSQKTVVFVFLVMRTWNLTQLDVSPESWDRSRFRNSVS